MAINGSKPAGVRRRSKRLARPASVQFEQPILGVSELARKLEMPKSSVSRLAKTLALEGFITPVAGGYRLGLKLHELGALVVSGLELREVAHAKLLKLRNFSGETVHLAVLDGTEVVYLDRIESPDTLHVFTRLGKRMPAHCTSSGKAILAYESPAVVDAVVANGLQRFTPRTIVSRAALERALEGTRANGWASSIDESELGLSSLAAPIFDYTTRAVAAISLAGPGERFTPSATARMVQHIKEATTEISRELGYRPCAPFPAVIETRLMRTTI